MASARPSKGRWAKGTVLLRGRDASEEVIGHISPSGRFALNLGKHRLWNVTHAPTGMSLDLLNVNLADAMAYCDALDRELGSISVDELPGSRGFPSDRFMSAMTSARKRVARPSRS